MASMAQEGADLESPSGVASGNVVASCQRAVVWLDTRKREKNSQVQYRTCVKRPFEI